MEADCAGAEVRNAVTSVRVLSVLAGLFLAAFQQNPSYADEFGAPRIQLAAISTRAPAVDVDSHAQRGRTLLNRGDYDRAIAEYSEAILLVPMFAGAYHERGFARYTKGDYDLAITDLNEAIRLNPISEAYRDRSLAYLYAGQPANAQADLKKAIELKPKDAYLAIWLDIVEQRSKVASHLLEATSRLDMTAWPAPVVRMFLAQTTLAAVLAAADDPDATKRNGQVCEANFYGGEYLLGQGAKDEAARLFTIAVRDCPRRFFEIGAAIGELKALDAKR